LSRWARRRVRALQAGDAASGRFLAPGDVAEYRVQVPGPGVLIVELRGEADPQAVAVELRASDGSPLGRTRARLAGAGTVSARLTYRGTGPAAYDVRFLYNPQAPVRCALRVRPAGRGLLEATVEVVNAGRTRYPLAEPGPGTVTWRVGDEVVAGAHPGAPPPMVFLEPGERRHYTARLALPAGARPARRGCRARRLRRCRHHSQGPVAARKTSSSAARSMTQGPNRPKMRPLWRSSRTRSHGSMVAA